MPIWGYQEVPGACPGDGSGIRNSCPTRTAITKAPFLGLFPGKNLTSQLPQRLEKTKPKFPDSGCLLGSGGPVARIRGPPPEGVVLQHVGPATEGNRAQQSQEEPRVWLALHQPAGRIPHRLRERVHLTSTGRKESGDGRPGGQSNQCQQQHVRAKGELSDVSTELCRLCSNKAPGSKVSRT